MIDPNLIAHAVRRRAGFPTIIAGRPAQWPARSGCRCLRGIFSYLSGITFSHLGQRHKRLIGGARPAHQHRATIALDQLPARRDQHVLIVEDLGIHNPPFGAAGAEPGVAYFLHEFLESAERIGKMMPSETLMTPSSLRTTCLSGSRSRLSFHCSCACHRRYSRQAGPAISTK